MIDIVEKKVAGRPRAKKKKTRHPKANSHSTAEDQLDEEGWAASVGVGSDNGLETGAKTEPETGGRRSAGRKP